MKLTQSEVGWRVEITPELAFHFAAMHEAQIFINLIDAGQTPMQALRNVTELRQESGPARPAGGDDGTVDNYG